MIHIPSLNQNRWWCLLAGKAPTERKRAGKRGFTPPGRTWPFDVAWDYILCPGLAYNMCTVKSSLVVRIFGDTTLPVVEDGISEVQGQPGLHSEFKTNPADRKTFSKTQNPIRPTKQETNSPPVNGWLSLNGGF